ncbi:SMI1/KNR4 family protein [Kitasatospora sp. NPDC048407]|uniref:SMI1/KNR4 family protein n=1 Tax=Kitasatospora sp. NPDC048407 TaxID=3364051 RepID=UPI003720E767
MRDYLGAVLNMIGPSPADRPEFVEWGEVEGLLGAELPADFKEIVETYAPVTLNHHLVLTRPGTQFFNLAERLEQQIKGLKESDWDGAGVTFRGATPTFGGPDGLIPVASTDRREGAFLVRPAGGEGWHMAGMVLDGQFVEYEMGFSEWLYRYLMGEDMLGPRSGVFYPGPLVIEDLPKSPGDAVTARRGPARMI